MSAPVVIQAGGKGTRLLPYTAVLPKPLMPIGERPILEIVVRQLVHFGFTDLYITTGHLAHLIELFFGDGSAWGAKITYLREDQPLGTVGAVKLMPRPDVPFLVMNGDLLTDVDYRAIYDYHLSHSSPLTVGVYRGDIPVSLGVIEYDEASSITAFREKPLLHFWASMGVYVFSPELWDSIPQATSYGFDSLMNDLLSQGKIAKVFPWHGMWLDIGRPEDYAVAGEVFEKNKERLFHESAG